jgi:S-(hydroxymethyl)glutathione dehydrogenase/alcohol dehydrogenase
MRNLPKTMKAAVLTEIKAPLVIAELTVPDKLGVGQLFVKIHFSGICGSQLGEIDGAKGDDRFLPHLLGHEASATVLEIGAGVRHVSVGDNVVMHWRKGLGIEADTPKYSWHGRTVNAGWITTFQEYAIVSENRVTPIPADSEMDIAALFGCAVTTGFGVVQNNAGIRIGESVVVFGAGGIGLSIVQAASLAGAHPVIAVDLYPAKLDLARRFGASHCIDARANDSREAIAEILGDTGLDVFIDNTGQPHIIEMGYEIVAGQGRVILVGVPKKGNTININSLQLHFGKLLIGSHGGEAIPQVDIPRLMRYYRQGKLELRGLITNEYRLEDINTAISDMRDGKVTGRCLIKL